MVMDKRLEVRIKDLVIDLMYYDRKEDEELTREDIEKMVKDDPKLIDQIAELFKAELIEWRDG